MSKCYSIQTVDNKIENKSKEISKNYCKKNHTHEYFKKLLFNEINNNKAEFYRISLKKWKINNPITIKR